MTGKTIRLHRREAVEFLIEHGFPATYNMIEKLASTGGGPSFQMWGKYAMYTPPNLLKWAESRLSPVLNSTSEKPRRPRKAKPAAAAPVDKSVDIPAPKKRGRPKKIVAADPVEKRKTGRPRKIVADAVQAAPQRELIKAAAGKAVTA